MEIANRIAEILNTFTDDSQALIFKKCEEFKFDPDKGDISLNESFINLNQARAILLDAIEKSKLAQLPLSIQKAVLSILERIQSHQVNILGGVDDIINLVNAIESLYTTIWTNGFHNLSTELLGYTTKMNQLKDQELRANALNKELEKGLELRDQLSKLFETITKASEEIKTYEEKAKGTLESISENSASSLKSTQEASAHLATISNNDQAVTQLLTNSKTSNSEIISLESKVREFFTAIETYRSEILTIKDTATSTVTKHNSDTDNLVTRLSGLEDQIKDQITRATGYSLFQSFQIRQGQLHDSKKYWLYGIFSIIGASIIVTLYIAQNTVIVGDVAFYLKLSVSLPLLFALIFCATQYNRERRLEEEYAFKSNISISLEPYKDLVEKLVGSDPLEKAKFTAFIIDSITKVFTSPTKRIFDKEKSDMKPEDLLKQTSELIKPFLETLKK